MMTYLSNTLYAPSRPLRVNALCLCALCALALPPALLPTHDRERKALQERNAAAPFSRTSGRGAGGEGEHKAAKRVKAQMT